MMCTAHLQTSEQSLTESSKARYQLTVATESLYSLGKSDPRCLQSFRVCVKCHAAAGHADVQSVHS